MLYLIGLGLDLKDLSLRALESIKKCKKVYLETYTTTLPYKIEKLEQFIKKKIIIANREKIENDLNNFISQAKREDIALLIYGDPLAATTHITILREAKKQKLKVEIIHNISIFNVLSETGLQLYKFGKTTSLPRWQKGYTPTSFLQVVEENLSIGAHTLILVEPGLSLKEALEEIKEADSDNLLQDKELIIASRLGTKNAKIVKGKIKELLKKGKIEEPFCIIVPGTLHFSEQD